MSTYYISVLIDKPENFRWKIETPWGIIEYDCGGFYHPENIPESVARYILENEIKSFEKHEKEG